MCLKSRRTVHTSTPTGTPTATRARSHSFRSPTSKKALLIGINYKHRPEKYPDGRYLYQLSKSHDDCRSAKRLLIDVFHYRPENVTMLIDEEGTNPEEMPTFANIMRAMQTLVDDMKAGHHVFFCYVGHGGNTLDFRRLEQVQGSSYILPYDADWPTDDGTHAKNIITVDMFRETLVQKLPAGSTMVAVFDCCFSGGVLALPHKWTEERCNFVKKNSPPTTETEPFITLPQSGCHCATCNLNSDPTSGIGRTLCISACGDRERAWESPFGGILTRALHDAYLEGKDKNFTFHDLFKFIGARYKSMNNGNLPEPQNFEISSSHPFMDEGDHTGPRYLWMDSKISCVEEGDQMEDEVARL